MFPNWFFRNQVQINRGSAIHTPSNTVDVNRGHVRRKLSKDGCASSNVGGHNLLPLVDLPTPGWEFAHYAHPSPRTLQKFLDARLFLGKADETSYNWRIFFIEIDNTLKFQKIDKKCKYINVSSVESHISRSLFGFLAWDTSRYITVLFLKQENDLAFILEKNSNSYLHTW